MRVTAQNIVRAINQLPRDREYQYANPANSGRIVIHHVQEPEGPIEYKRYNPEKGQKLIDQKVERMSVPMIWRMANTIFPGVPINVDRALAGSGNNRSVFEGLLAHTPLFYVCKPGRIEQMNAYKKVKPGLKHLIYLPEEPHEKGILGFKEVNMQISEVTVDVVYKGVGLEAVEPESGMSIEQKRRHAQIQIALVLIGQHLGFRTWVASNDRGIEYEGKRLAEIDTVIDDLTSEQLLSAYPDASRAARLIDCVWFQNGRLMPAVMEIEHSTGVTSGLTRMKGFFDTAPQIRNIRWTIVAPDDDRQKVIEQANREQFREMETKFFPYSAVEELYSLCERRKPQGVTDKFLDCFMEDCVA